MKHYIGTSGWLYKDWDKRFYPPKMKGTDKLPFFAEHFSTVEINSTFYHMPTPKSTQRWYDETPKNFLFAVKLNRYLTHTKKLVPDDDFADSLEDFYKNIAPLQEKLGVMLVQLPPTLKINLSRIEALASQHKKLQKKLHVTFPLAVEFRHASWLEPKTFILLRKLGIAMAIIDSPGRWPASKEVTADILYIRFHGSKWLYRSHYTGKELKDWADFIKKHSRGKKVFAYFNNDHAAAAITNAVQLKKLLAFKHPAS